MTQTRAVDTAAWFAITIASLYIVVAGKDLLMPVAVAVMIWYMLNALSRALEKYIPGGDKVGHGLWLAVSMVIMVALLAMTFDFIAESIYGVSEAVPRYQENILRLADRAALALGLEKTPSIKQFLETIDLKWAVGGVAGLVTTIAGNIGIISIYVVFLLLEQHIFDRKLASLFPNTKRQEEVRGLIGKIQLRIMDYVWIKTLMSVMTGVASYLILLAVGVDYASFWAFVIFLLNYIPTIGSLLGVIFPSLLALIQFPTFGPFVAVATLLGGVQLLIGNFLEPKMMGGKLNVSSLVVLFSLALWGKLWGVVGMFLCVPITVIMMIIFANFPRTRAIAIMLSGTGSVESMLVDSAPEKIGDGDEPG